ncbi:MAG TPA: tyrosinase family protein [Solirubrobacteraceae bacterium]|nr:tyrosinase family protein [Solirubrobacteraceae bacterium]
MATLQLRKSVDKLLPADLVAVREAFSQAMALTDNRGFGYFAGWHGRPFDWCQHHTSLFLPWHRAYLYYFELALQALVPGVTLPWWDWTTASTIPSAYTDATDATGAANPLLVGQYTIYQSGQTQQAPARTPGETQGIPEVPYADSWNAAMQATDFAGFQTAIEAVHDDVHVWVGGIMQDIELAAYDPLFFAHHVMIDRSWRLWQTRNPGALPDASLLDVALQPNGMTVRQTLDVTRLGYDYAGTVTQVAGTVPPGSGGG